jgi:hypothetical protein
MNSFTASVLFKLLAAFLVDVFLVANFYSNNFLGTIRGLGAHL